MKTFLYINSVLRIEGAASNITKTCLFCVYYNTIKMNFYKKYFKEKITNKL